MHYKSLSKFQFGESNLLLVFDFVFTNEKTMIAYEKTMIAYLACCIRDI